MRGLLVALALCATTAVVADEFMVKMSDGVELSTIVNFPDLIFNQSGTFSAVMDRSPYGHDKLELIADLYVPQGHIAVRQDFRGTFDSQGNFTIWHKAADDSYDTIEWLKNTVDGPFGDFNVNMVGQVGASADGLASYATLKKINPLTYAAFNIFTASRGYEIIFPQGGFRQSLAEIWIGSTVKNKTEAAIDIEVVKENEGPNPWWDALNITAADFAKVTYPSVQWAGWYDIFLVGQMFGWEGYQKQSANPGKSKLVIDPLGHCQGAASYFAKDVIMGRVLLPVFLSLDLFKQDTHYAENVSAVTFYVMGPNVNTPFVGEYWVSLPDFPAFTPTSYYLSSNNALTTSVPTTEDKTTYTFDPSNPVPSTGGNNLEIECGPLDQRPVENRPDVVLFTSDTFSENVALTGPINARLFVQSDAVDTDFTAKFTDVYPDGTSRLIQDGIVRMRWRGAPAAGPDPQPITPGQTYEIEVSLWNTSYVINQGHRIRLAVSSSNAPRFSVNPNTGEPLAKNTSAPVVAHNTVLYGPSHPSALILPVVPLSALPEFPVLDVVARGLALAEKEGRTDILEVAKTLTLAQEEATARLSAGGRSFPAFPLHPLHGIYGDDARQAILSR